VLYVLFHDRNLDACLPSGPRDLPLLLRQARVRLNVGSGSPVHLPPGVTVAMNATSMSILPHIPAKMHECLLDAARGRE
jgi:hypothetical protein